MLQMVMSAGPVTPVTATGKHGASAATVLPSVSVATLSRNLIAPEVVSLAVKLPAALTAVSRLMPVTATTPRLAAVMTPVLPITRQAGVVDILANFDQLSDGDVDSLLADMLADGARV